MSDYASAKGMYPNYCSFGKEPGKATGAGILQPSTIMRVMKICRKHYFPQALIILARVMNYYKSHLVLPKNISTWWSDFLRSTDNCPIDDQVVVAAKNQAIEGKSTSREKQKRFSSMQETNGNGKTTTIPGRERSAQSMRKAAIVVICPMRSWPCVVLQEFRPDIFTGNAISRPLS